MEVYCSAMQVCMGIRTGPGTGTDTLQLQLHECECECPTDTHTISGIEREESDLYPSWSMHEIQFVILHYSTRWSRCFCCKCSSFPQCLFLSDKRCQDTLPFSSPGSCPVFDIRDSAAPHPSTLLQYIVYVSGGEPPLHVPQCI